MEPKDPAPAAASGALPKPAATDPGTVCTNWEKTRPFSGSEVTSCPLSTSPNDELVGSIRALLAVTGTDWLAAPTRSVTGSGVVLSTVTTIPLEIVVSMPDAATV